MRNASQITENWSKLTENQRIKLVEDVVGMISEREQQEGHESVLLVSAGLLAAAILRDCGTDQPRLPLAAE